MEQVAEFDAAYDAALSAARQTLRLDQLRHTLRVWRRMALMAEQDPDGHRQLLATVAEVQRTGQPRPGSVPWTELKTALGLRIGGLVDELAAQQLSDLIPGGLQLPPWRRTETTSKAASAP